MIVIATHPMQSEEIEVEVPRPWELAILPYLPHRSGGQDFPNLSLARYEGRVAHEQSLDDHDRLHPHGLIHTHENFRRIRWWA